MTLANVLSNDILRNTKRAQPYVSLRSESSPFSETELE